MARITLVNESEVLVHSFSPSPACNLRELCTLATAACALLVSAGAALNSLSAAQSLYTTASVRPLVSRPLATHTPIHPVPSVSAASAYPTVQQPQVAPLSPWQSTASSLRSQIVARLAPVDVEPLQQASEQFPWAVGVSGALFGLGTVTGKFDRVLTPLMPNPLLSGITHSFLLSVILWTCLGWKGWSVCVLYLFLGVAVTKDAYVGRATGAPFALCIYLGVRSKEKEAAGIAEGRGGARGPENVWGSAATASICALLTLAFPEQTPLLALGYVASLATKLSDTCGSEIGKAYGKTPILITTLQQVPPGTEGAVSVEGTVAGIIGSAVLAAFAVPAGLINFTGVGIAMVAAFIACNVESFLGATVQGNIKWLTNEVINFINTTVGAIVAAVLGLLVGLVGVSI